MQEHIKHNTTQSPAFTQKTQQKSFKTQNTKLISFLSGFHTIRLVKSLFKCFFQAVLMQFLSIKRFYFLSSFFYKQRLLSCVKRIKTRLKLCNMKARF